MKTTAAPRLRVERLEPRCTPATFTVTTTADSGSGSLRAAVAAAEADPAPDTIQFAPAISGMPIILKTSQDTAEGQSAFDIRTAVTIVGNGTQLSGGGSNSARYFRFATVEPTGSLTLQNVGLVRFASGGGAGGGGGAGLGGAVYNQGTFRAFAVTFNGNFAIGGEGRYGGIGQNGGGGIRDSGTSTAGGGLNGGGTNNTSADGGFGGGGKPGDDGKMPGDAGAAGGNGGFGGGGGTGGSGADNFAVTPGGQDGPGGDAGNGGNGGFGGGAAAPGGVGAGNPFGHTGAGGKAGFGGGAANDAGTGGGGAGMGGAIFNQGGLVVVADSTFTGNSATGGDSLPDTVSAGGKNVQNLQGQGGAGYGGAVFNLNGTVTVVGGVLQDNAVNPGAGNPALPTPEAAGADFYNLSLAADPAVPAGPARFIVPTIPGVTPLTYDVVNNPADGAATLSIALADIPHGRLAFTPDSPLDAGAVGKAYSTQLSVDGGPGYFWLAGDYLPFGLKLSADGLLSGTPTTIGVYSFTVAATDGRVQDTQSYTMIVGPTDEGIRENGTLTGFVGQPIAPVTFTPFVDPAVPGTFPLSVTGGSLPPGLTLAPGGTLSGTPTAGGTFPFALAWTSTLPLVGASANYTITITDLPSSSTTDTRASNGLVPVVGPVANGGAPDGSVVFSTIPPQTFKPFGPIAGGVRTATERVTGDLAADLIAVTGPGTPIQLGVFSAPLGDFADVARDVVTPFDPFGGGFTGGGFVSAGDFDGDGHAEFVVSPDQGGGPRVEIYSVVNGAPALRANFYGIADTNFRGGARTAVGDVNGDGVPDLIVAAGYGGGPRVAVFDGRTLLTGATTRLVPDFYAFESTLRNGVYVAAGDVDGDGAADPIFGGGPGGGPRVMILGGKRLVSAGPDAAIAAPMANFFAGDATADRGGVRVAAKNLDVDKQADLVVGSGAGQAGDVREYLGTHLVGATGEPPIYQEFDPLTGAAPPDGIYVG